jgi:hypothetical protein
MGTNEQWRNRFQSGTETTPGTAVPATRRIYADISPSYARPLQAFPDRSGTRFSRRRAVHTRQTTGFSLTDLLTFEDILLWLQLGVVNLASGTGDEDLTDEAFTWGFTPEAEATNVASWTLEHNDAGNTYQSDQFMLNTWGIRINPDQDGAWMFDGQALARTWITDTYTAALAQRETEVIRAPGTLVWLDDATIGSTAATGKVIDFALQVNGNLALEAYMEDDQAWAANKITFGERTFDATMTMDFANDTEFAKFRSDNATERKVRIRRTGSTIHDTVKKQAQIDLYGYYNAISFGERNGKKTAQFGIQGFYDATAGTDCEFEVINTLGDAPGDEA